MKSLTHARHSLAKDSVSLSHVMAQGLISNGPLASTVAALTAAAAYSLGSLPLTYIMGGLMVFLWLNTPLQFSKKLASASGMQYFVAKGMGGVWGYMAGLSYALYYTALPAANAVLFSVIITSIMQQFGIAHPLAWLWVPLTLLFVIPSTILTYLGIKSSLSYGAATAIIEIVILVLVSLFIIAKVGAHNTMAVYNPHLAAGGISGFAIGSLVASFGMSGSTAAVYLGNEAKAPLTTIRKSLFASGAMIVLMFILVSYALTVGWGYTKMGSFASSSIPGLLVIHHYLGAAAELIFTVFVINSLIGINVASSIVVSRLFLSFSKAQLFPQKLGQIHATHQTPSQAVIVASLLTAVMAMAGGAIWGPSTGFVVLILIATMSMFLGHALGNIALPVYYAKLKALNWPIHILVPMISLGLILLGVFFTFFPITTPLVYAPIITLVVIGAGVIQYIFLARHRRHITEAAIQEIDLEDEAVVGD